MPKEKKVPTQKPVGKPKEKLSETELEAVTGGVAGGSLRKRDVHGHPLTSGPEGYVRPIKG